VYDNVDTPHSGIYIKLISKFKEFYILQVKYNGGKIKTPIIIDGGSEILIETGYDSNFNVSTRIPIAKKIT